MMYLFYVAQIATESRSGDFIVTTAKQSSVSMRKSKKITLRQKGNKLVSGPRSLSEEERIVTLDRRCSGRRTQPDRRKKNVPVNVERRVLQRRLKVNRRRQIDPTTCERDYSEDEIEFMNALDEYKRTSGRMFPTCSEVLEVLRKLGYEKRSPPEPAETPAALPVIAEVSLPLAAETAAIP
jgi:hypothetical protein